MDLPTWAAARLAFGVGIGEEQSATTSTSTNETRESRQSLIKSLVGEFLLDH
jgi:hypothetical protein